MDLIIFKPVLNALIRNPPPLRVWLNYLKYKLSDQSLTPTHTPISLVVYATKRCNFKCNFCFTWPDLNQSNWKDYELSVEMLTKILDSNFGLNALRIGLLGGEPFLNPHIFELLRLCHSRGKITTIVTNASHIKETQKELLLLDHPTMLGVSLYDNNRPEVANLSHWLAENKIPFWVQTVVTAENLSEMESAVDFAIEHKITNLILSNYNPANTSDFGKVIYEDNLIFKGITNALRKKAKRNGVQLTLPQPIQRKYSKRSCQMPFSYVHVDAKGVLGPCCFRSPKEIYGNIFDPFSWQNDANKNLRETFIDYTRPPLSECKNCENFSRDLYGV